MVPLRATEVCDGFDPLMCVSEHAPAGQLVQLVASNGE